MGRFPRNLEPWGRRGDGGAEGHGLHYTYRQDLFVLARSNETGRVILNDGKFQPKAW
ncbi:MAG: hypothetical protein RKP20_13900 [Candidatus Competibacter sp.]|nr:hypothetical protein [Candidatus Competibacter sp.]